MSAPSNTSWGSVVASGTHEGRIGISNTMENKGTYERVVVRVWFWSKYSVSDTNNRCDLAVSIDGVNNILKQGIASNISHPTNSAWSTQNQTLLTEYTIDLTKGKTSKTVIFNSSLQKIDILGSNVMYANKNYTINALESHTVSYNANGGTNAPSNQTKWYGTALLLSSTKPTRTGYDFLGWGTSSTDTTVDYQPNSYYYADANITLYAIWKAHTYTVSYNANGGTNAPSNQIKTHDVNLTLSSTKPTRTNYNFLGWATNSSATTPTYNAGGVYTNNSAITLYAVWELAYVKPRISNFVIWRVDANGNASDDGEYAKISFTWETDRTGARYCAYYKRSDQDTYLPCVGVDSGETSGSVVTFLSNASGNVKFDTDFAYDIQLNVADSFGYNYAEKVLHATFLTFDVTPDGKNMSFGESAHDYEDEVLRFRFKTVDIAPKQNLQYKGGKFFGGNLLWQGNSLFTEASQITIPSVASQRNGLLFVFARNGDYNFMSYFVPKELIANVTTASVTFPLCTSLFDYIGQKTLYITDTTVKGHTDNDATGKNATSGITYHNEAFYLRYVYGV